MPKFRVLILVNSGVKAGFADDLEVWAGYEEQRLGIQLEVDVQECNIQPITHIAFGITAVSKDPITGKSNMLEMYGLNNIKEKIREAGIVEQGQYHAVVFAYDYENTEIYRTKPGQVGHWCYFEPLYTGTEFIELATTLYWDKVGDIFRVLSHEIRHAYVNRLRRRGVGVPDVMDLTPVTVSCDTRTPNPTGACTEHIPYFREFEPYASDGNRAVQDKIVKPLMARIVEAPELTGWIATLKSIVAGLQKQIADMLKPKDSPLLVKWAEAIKRHEGWYVGSRSYRNNNPGNFRYAPLIKELGAIDRDEKGYAIFRTQNEGFQALLGFLRYAQKNQLRGYRQYAIDQRRPDNMPLLKDFFAVYSPDSDNVPVGLSSSMQYAQSVATYIGNGVTVETRVDRI